MHYLLLFLLLIPCVGKAQSKVTGLGKYRIGISTADSLEPAEFDEQPVLVKGTVALPCTHIRLFKTIRTEVAGTVVTNLFLYFYDNTLFKISCDADDKLQRALSQKHGQGVLIPVRQFKGCIPQTDRIIRLWGESWLNGDISALAVHTKSYIADYQTDESFRLLIASHQMLALASDCDLPDDYTCLDEFSK